MRHRVFALAGLVVLALVGGACAKARAEAVPQGPPLQVPAPPQRVVAPVEEPPIVEVAPPPEPLPIIPPPPPQPTAEEKPAPPAAAPPRPAAAAPQPPRDLRPASPASAPSERNVRDLLARAARDINQVDYGRLTIEGRSQYEQSKRFSIQAEQALRDRDLIFAATLADKAATLAEELLRR